MRRDRSNETWRELNPRGVFMIVPMTDSFDQLHENDHVFSTVIFYITMVAIFISVIGLYAVSSYTAEQRRKEIGIRKVWVRVSVVLLSSWLRHTST
ncbi:MAG: hypothetical protein WDO15_15315 [Bacteroidota bacterium]